MRRRWGGYACSVVMPYVDTVVSSECALHAENTNSDTSLTLRVPASLLLCGEYFVTQRRGQGLCLALDPSARCTITWHRQKTERCTNTPYLITHFAHRKHVFENAYENKMYMLCEQCKDPYLKMYKSHNMHNARRISISMNTNAFYTEVRRNQKDVQKRGLGSSESAALLMCASLALCNGKDPLTNRQVLASHAAHVHYLWQGGRGSGYGVWTATFGGMGIYTNNADTNASMPFVQNIWNALPHEIFSSLHWWFWNCGHTQSSQNALLCYRAWQRENPEDEQKFLAQYAQLFRVFERDVSKYQQDMLYARSVVQVMKQAKALGLWLGTRIGVSAEVQRSNTAETIPNMSTYKAVGAGCECAVGVSYDNEQDNHVSDVKSLMVAEGIHYVASEKRF